MSVCLYFVDADQVEIFTNAWSMYPIGEDKTVIVYLSGQGLGCWAEHTIMVPFAAMRHHIKEAIGSNTDVDLTNPKIPDIIRRWKADNAPISSL